MLTTDDVINLFAALRTAYGPQWKQGNEAISVWRTALARFDAAKIQKAAGDALETYVDHPPTLPQFLSLLRPKVYSQTPNTYLPPPRMPPAQAVSNRTLLSVLVRSGGVDRVTETNLVALKRALTEEHGEDVAPTKEFVADLHAQLTALAVNHDKEARAKEAMEGRRAFCRRWGFPDPVLQ